MFPLRFLSVSPVPQLVYSVHLIFPSLVEMIAPQCRRNFFGFSMGGINCSSEANYKTGKLDIIRVII